MIYVSKPYSTPPLTFKTPLQEKVYRTLDLLGIDYVRVDTDPAITMEDCDTIDSFLGTKMVKTLLVCNRQQTSFYLFVTCGHKPFSTKDFGHSLGISRVSFASEQQMTDLLGTERGAATIFSALLQSSENVRIIIDNEVLSEEFYGCSDGTTTGYMKVRTECIINKFQRYTGRTFRVVELVPSE